MHPLNRPNTHRPQPSPLKRTRPILQQPDFEDPSPIKKLAKSFENSIGFSERTNPQSQSLSFSQARLDVQTHEKMEQSQQISFTTELRRVQQGDLAGVSRFKSLLPEHLTAKLSPQYELLLRVAKETDQILQNNKQVRHQEALESVCQQLQHTLNVNISLKCFTQLNFLVPTLYRLFVDPLKNIVIGFPSSHDPLSVRKYQLKKSLYNFAKENVQSEDTIQETMKAIPELEFEVVKTPLFFPRSNMTIPKSSFPILNDPSKSLREQLIEQMKGDVKMKEQQFALEPQQQEAMPQTLSLGQKRQFEFEQFIDKVEQLFKNYKVTNVYLVNLLEWLHDRRLPKRQVFRLLTSLQETGLLKICELAPGSPKIVKWHSGQKQNALQTPRRR